MPWIINNARLLITTTTEIPERGPYGNNNNNRDPGTVPMGVITIKIINNTRDY